MLRSKFLLIVLIFNYIIGLSQGTETAMDFLYCKNRCIVNHFYKGKERKSELSKFQLINSNETFLFSNLDLFNDAIRLKDAEWNCLKSGYLRQKNKLVAIYYKERNFSKSSTDNVVDSLGVLDNTNVICSKYQIWHYDRNKEFQIPYIDSTQIVVVSDNDNPELKDIYNLTTNYNGKFVVMFSHRICNNLVAIIKPYNPNIGSLGMYHSLQIPPAPLILFFRLNEDNKILKVKRFKKKVKYGPDFSAPVLKQ